MALSKEVKERIRHQFENIVNPTNVYWAKDAVKKVELHLAGVSGGVTATTTKEGKTVLKALDDAKKYWLELANARLEQLQKKLDSENERKLLRRNLAERRQMDDQPLDHSALYRKMSIEEWQSMFGDWKHDTPEKGRYVNGDDKKHIRFEKCFKNTDTRNYRLWFSTSLMKCRKFENKNATKRTDVVVRFWFSESAKERFSKNEMLPHKQKGVQNNPDVVAWHREEFAEEDPNISETKIMKERLNLPVSGGHELPRQYNLGFTSKQSAWLKEKCVAAEPMY